MNNNIKLTHETGIAIEDLINCCRDVTRMSGISHRTHEAAVAISNECSAWMRTNFIDVGTFATLIAGVRDRIYSPQNDAELFIVKT